MSALSVQHGIDRLEASRRERAARPFVLRTIIGPRKTPCYLQPGGKFEPWAYETAATFPKRDAAYARLREIGISDSRGINAIRRP